MKIERQLFNISILETFSYFVLLFVLINGFAFIYTIIEGDARFLLYNSSWILQIIFPIIMTVIQNYINRNGVIKISNFNNIEIVKNKIEILIQKRGLIKTDKESELDNYTKKTKWGRFFNVFFREDINVKYLKDEVLIYGKRNMFSPIESKLRYDTTTN